MQICIVVDLPFSVISEKNSLVLLRNLPKKSRAAVLFCSEHLFLNIYYRSSQRLYATKSRSLIPIESIWQMPDDSFLIRNISFFLKVRWLGGSHSKEWTNRLVARTNGQMMYCFANDRENA